jgi:transaldolase
MYVDPLIGPETVNTMTLETIDAFRDHGTVRCDAIRQGRDEAVQALNALERAGISMKSVTDQLTEEGVQKFSASLHALLDTMREREGSIVRA